MKRTLLHIFVIVLLVFILISIINKASKPIVGTKKIKIVTTLYPLYDFARNIGQDKVDVTLLLPPGISAHTFEPKPSDIVRINHADIFIYIGRFMEPWADTVIKGISNNNVLVIDASIDAKMIPSVFQDKDEPALSMDPHIWLDFDNDKAIIQTIAHALIKMDKVNAGYYIHNADKYKADLTMIDKQYKSSLSNCKSKIILSAGHYAFGYLAERYDLKYLAAQGISPDAEPIAKDLIALVKQIQKNHIKYIFYEELSSPKIAKTISNETKAKMLVLNAAHNISKKDYLDKNISFLSIMQRNLDNLMIGLECSEGL